MAIFNTGGYQSPEAVLPAAFNSPGQTIEQGIQNQERQGERTLQLNQQIQQRQAERRMQNLRLIDSDTNFDQYKTGNIALDNYAHGELRNISNYALTNLTNLPPDEMQFRINQMMQPLMQWHSQATDAYAQGKQAVDDITKKYPNADPSVVRGTFNNLFQNDFLNPDGTRKNTDLIQPTNYGAALEKSENLLPAIHDTSPFETAINAIPLQPVGDENYTNKQGHVVAYKWSGMMPKGDMGEMQYDANGKPTAIRLAGTDIPGVTDPATGQPMRVLNDTMMQRLYAKPDIAAAADKMWATVKPQIEANYTQKTGQQLDPRTDDLLKRAYLYQQANSLIGHDLKTEEIQKTPRITINTGAANTSINDINSEVEQKASSANPGQGFPLAGLSTTAQAVLLKIANELNPHEPMESPLGQKDIYIKKEPDGKITLRKASDNSIIAPLDEKDLNLQANKSIKQQQHILQGQQQQPTNDNSNYWEQFKR